MREILFRGKLKEDKKWKLGDLITHGDKKTYILNDDEGYGEYDTGWGEEVYPDTVGQYTGKDDTNNKKAFEGDIVRGRFGSYRLGLVIFYQGCFCIESYCNGKPTGTYHDIHTSTLTVIGNIHDNPELLEDK